MDKEILRRVREFNRFYAVKLNVFNKNVLGTEYSLAEGRIVGEIGRKPGCLAQEIAEGLAMDKSYLSRILNRLEDGGLLLRQVSEADSRKKHLFLTYTGQKVFEDLEQKSDAQVLDMLKGVDNMKQQRVLACMDCLQSVLSCPALDGIGYDEDSGSENGTAAQVEMVPGYERLDQVKELFLEYTDSIIEIAPEVRSILEAQHIDDEMADIPAKYGMPSGRLYLALVNGQAAGCIALRKLTDQVCEMKRLYVRDAFKRLHIGRQLAEQVIADARKIGYEAVRLDTLPVMTAAIGLYHSLGFREIEKYYENPGEDNIYMELDLR